MPWIDEFLAEPDEPADWIVNPYAVRQGVTFLYGETSVGKSPLVWEMARVVSQGLPFFGYETSQTPVLYIEADTAERLVRPRMRLLPEPKGGELWVENIYSSGMHVHDGSLERYFAQLREHTWRGWEPGLVIWNTLRDIYRGDANSSETPPRVYTAIQKLFPAAGHVVTAHERKGSKNPDARQDLERQDFSGSQAWADKAAIGIHLVRRSDKQGEYIAMEYVKSQVSDRFAPLNLVLDADGTQFRVLGETRTSTILNALKTAPGASTGDKVEWVVANMNVSRASVYRAMHAGKAMEDAA